MLKNSISELVCQGCHVIVVDNGSVNTLQIKSSVSAFENTVFSSQEQNLGLGAAHNIGIKFAGEQGYDYVLIMDQDSVPLADMVANLVTAHKLKSANGLVSAVGVTYLNLETHSESFFVRFGALKFARHYCSEKDSDGCVEADFLISSGSLISMQAIDIIGEMDETLFIDHVDTEWFLRARSKKFKAYGVCNATMEHGLGESTHRITLGSRQRNVPQHKPFRYYYIFRNSIALYKRGYASNLWKWNDVQRLAMIMVMFGLLKSPRWANLSMMLKGMRHGLIGRFGPLAIDSETSND